VKPVLFVTNLVPPDRAGAFAALHAREGIELALFGGRSHHATAGLDDPGVPHRHVPQRAVARLAASRRYRAVVCGTAGRVALPAAYAGARAGRVPFVLWSALWADLDTPAHRAARPLLRRIHRGAGAVATYGEHVSAYARAQGARNVHVAPQAVDNAFWSAPVDRGSDGFTALYVGRVAPGKGVDVLLEAWRTAGLAKDGATLRLVGPTPAELPGAPGAGVDAVGPRAPATVRNFLARTSVLVMPSVPTPSFREPWGLVANEAMNQRIPVIATDAVGAAAGGLVRDGRNGLVVRAGDPAALAGALGRLHAHPALGERLGAAGKQDVAAHTFDAWAAGMAAALASATSFTPGRTC
jgi:glycosyltransferase involved in cell wall biosynthesis